MATNNNLRQLTVKEFFGFNAAKGGVDSFLLTANTAKTITVPTFLTASGSQVAARYCLIKADANIWVNWSTTATIPAGDTIDGTGSELNPDFRILESVSTFSIISASAAKLSICFFK